MHIWLLLSALTYTQKALIHAVLGLTTLKRSQVLFFLPLSCHYADDISHSFAISLSDENFPTFLNQIIPRTFIYLDSSHITLTYHREEAP